MAFQFGQNETQVVSVSNIEINIGKLAQSLERWLSPLAIGSGNLGNGKWGPAFGDTIWRPELGDTICNHLAEISCRAAKQHKVNC